MPSIEAPQIPLVHLIAASNRWTIAFVVALLLFTTYYASTHLEPSFWPGIEIIKPERTGGLTHLKAKKQFRDHAKELLWRGLRTCKGAFQIISETGPDIILPMRYIDEVKNDRRLSLAGFVEKEFFTSLSGFEGLKAIQSTQLVQDSVKLKLTQSLNLITNDLCEETEVAIKEVLGDNADWKNVKFMHSAPALVSRLSSRVFLGKDFARDPAWLDIAVSYTIVIIYAARDLRMWPEALRSYVHWFLPTCIYLRKLNRQARKIMSEELVVRRARREEYLRNGVRPPKNSDSLGWMLEITKDDPNYDYAGAQLGLTFAAIHTTSDLLTKCMYNLVSYPEYLEPIRREMIDVLSREGMQKTSLYQLKLLDSFMKETHRIHSPGLTSMHRTAKDDVVLSDGTTLPKGSSVKVLLDGQHDESVYPNAGQFDGYRFLKLRSQPGQEQNYQFVTVTKTAATFGFGMHACPGRFFASNEVKIVMCYLLLHFEWKLANEKKRPGLIYDGFSQLADQSVELMYRRRQPEIDLSSLLSANPSVEA